MSQNQNRGPVILVEGLDLAGKSTLVSFLRQKLSEQYKKVRYSRNSLVPDNPFAEFADKERKKEDVPLNETCPLFIAAHLFDAHNFCFPNVSEIHLQDSSWLRTLAFNTIRDNNKFIPLLNQVAEYQPQFDAVIYLTASTKVRQKRVLKREEDSPEDNDHSDYLVYSDPDMFEKNDQMLLNTARQYCAQVLVIDTSDMTPAEVQESTWRHLQKLNVVS